MRVVQIGDTKQVINLTVFDQFALVTSIRNDIDGFNITKNINELQGMLAVLYLPTGSLAGLLQSVVLMDRQPTLI